MEFLLSLLTSLFANNIVLHGHGLKDAATFHTHKRSWILVILFFAEAVILGLCSYGFSYLIKVDEIFKYLSILFFVIISIGCDLVFYALIHKFAPAEIKEEMLHEGVSIAINSALLDISLTILLLIDASVLTTLGTCIGLPLGFICATYVTGAILERVSGSDNPRGFKGLPLVLITIAILALAASALKF